MKSLKALIETWRCRADVEEKLAALCEDDPNFGEQKLGHQRTAEAYLECAMMLEAQIKRGKMEPTIVRFEFCDNCGKPMKLHGNRCTQCGYDGIRVGEQDGT